VRVCARSLKIASQYKRIRCSLSVATCLRCATRSKVTVAGVLDGLLHRTVGEKVKAVLGKLE
jgi:hypothetical protein